MEEPTKEKLQKNIESNLKNILREFPLYRSEDYTYIYLPHKYSLKNTFGIYMQYGEKYKEDSSRFILEGGVEEGTIFINTFNIPKKCRHLGYGNKLYSLMEKFCKENFRIKKFKLDSLKENTEFWEKHGFNQKELSYYEKIIN